MHAYDFATASDIRQATSSSGAFLAGGTTLVDLMKLGALRPDHVIDINSLPLRGIRTGRDGVHIGALERMSDLAIDRIIIGHYPVFAQALSVSASPQIRNMASIGGNLLQSTRCGYFRDVTTACNKRQPGSGCPTRTGDNREHAILGTSTSCVAMHASDAAVALMALDASVRLVGRDDERSVRLAEFYRLPGGSPDVENQLRPGELIAELILPKLDWARTSTYVKVRDRQSYEFALCSAAVALDVRGSRIRDARVAAGSPPSRPL